MSKCDVYFKLTIHKVDWLRMHSRSVTDARRILRVMQVTNIRNYSSRLNICQAAAHDFLAGIAAHIGGGSRRIPELCSITLEVTPQNPIRGFRLSRLLSLFTLIYSGTVVWKQVLMIYQDL
jgi:hypothetical protein